MSQEVGNPALRPGTVAMAEMGAGQGREQAGRRPVVVMSSPDHLEIAETLVTVLPCTSRDRAWPNHVELSGSTGLARRTFAMTEQVRTIDRRRIVDVAGEVSDDCLVDIGRWLRDWLV